MKDTMIGVDLAKNIIVLHGTSMTGELRFRKKLSRSQFIQFMQRQPAAVVVLEACGSAHFWARELAAYGHEVKLIAPQYVRPFVKRQKNDMADAEAIAVAARQPEMRFVEPKTPDQQARAVLFRGRERLVHQRTELVNALRAVLYEFGQIVPQGIANIKRIDAIIRDATIDLPDVVREECRDLLAQIAEKTARIEPRTAQFTDVSRGSIAATRLQTMPGVGPMIALAVEAFAPAMTTFRSGRDFAACLDLYHDNSLLEAKSGSAACRRRGRLTYAGF